MTTILIANRGEIARRVMRTCKKISIRTVAVYSTADAAAPFVREADTAICIGPAPARESYLNQNAILEAARASNATAIHPGYGFLSENAEFAQRVQDAGLVWIGAPPASIRAMGLKDAAKRLMMDAGVPVTPGYMGEQSAARLESEATAIGYPVLIKAVAGGGGKGMRRVEHAADFAASLESCRREAASSFGDERVLLEKYILAPRHIEVQVFGDTHGNVVHLFERDCSLQRRHQKVIEEAPAPGMDPQTRNAICEAAVQAARAVNYVGAGTIEFIADGSEGLRADRIWFMEMNTRLQVEHPVTESITGVDLVEWQIRVAHGEKLPLTQAQLRIDGWAMEARLYAENPATGFLPSTGRLDRLRFPAGIRLDTGVEEGGEITAFYDPMIAKLIVHGPNRATACARLAAACAEVQIWPVHANAGFLARAASHPEFVAGRVDTGFIERHHDALVPALPSIVPAAAAAALAAPQPGDPWSMLTGFRANAAPERRVAVVVAGVTHLVEPQAAGTVVPLEGRQILFLAGEAWDVGVPVASAVGAGGAGDGAILAPMPGRIIALEVADGDTVTAGQALMTMEAMKMELRLVAPFAGTVSALVASVGAQISEGTVLARIG